MFNISTHIAIPAHDSQIKGNSSHIGRYIEYPDSFRGFPQLLQAWQDVRVLGWHIDYSDVLSWFISAPPGKCQDVRVLGWHIDYPDFFRGLPQLLQINARMREFSADTPTSLTFFVVSSAPSGKCENVRFAVPIEALLRTQFLLDVPRSLLNRSR